MKLDIKNPEAGDMIVGCHWTAIVCSANEKKTDQFLQEQDLKYFYMNRVEEIFKYATTTNSAHWLLHKGYKVIK